MQPELPRTSLNGSALVGLLAQLALVDRSTAPPSIVEGLGHWLGWREAIPLSAALLAAPVAGAPAAGSPVGSVAGSSNGSSKPASHAATATVAHLCAQVQRTLAQAIADDSSTAREDGNSFVPFRQRYFSLQQTMARAIDPLRTQARAAVAQRSPGLQRLAALDGVMAAALASREQTLLALMPVLLEKHHTRLRQAAAPALPGTAWLTVFRADMQRLLLAELELRLQPALGLLDTLHAAPGATHKDS